MRPIKIYFFSFGITGENGDHLEVLFQVEKQPSFSKHSPPIWWRHPSCFLPRVSISWCWLLQMEQMWKLEDLPSSAQVWKTESRPSADELAPWSMSVVHSYWSSPWQLGGCCEPSFAAVHLPWMIHSSSQPLWDRWIPSEGSSSWSTRNSFHWLILGFRRLLHLLEGERLVNPRELVRRTCHSLPKCLIWNRSTLAIVSSKMFVGWFSRSWAACGFWVGWGLWRTFHTCHMRMSLFLPIKKKEKNELNYK